MEKLRKLVSENKRAFAVGSAIALSAATALYIYRRRQFTNITSLGLHRWRDPHFKSENLPLYSVEAEMRAS